MEKPNYFTTDLIVPYDTMQKLIEKCRRDKLARKLPKIYKTLPHGQIVRDREAERIAFNKATR